MGLLDELRMSTGIALGPLEAYQRAFDKGVLLGNKSFGDAAELFAEASAKLQGADATLAHRAQANAAVYRFLAVRDPGAARQAAQALQGIAQVEVPGTQSEIMEAPLLAAEMNARGLELLAARSSGAQAAEAYLRAAHAWVPLFELRPVTFALTGEEALTDAGSTRFFLMAGQSAACRAETLVAHDPDGASELFAVAVQAFLRSGAEALAVKARERLTAARAERACWFCGRVMRGLGTNLRVLTAPASPYVARLLAGDADRAQSYNPAGSIVACVVCAGAVDAVAAARSAAVRDELQGQLASMSSTVASLMARLASLEMRASMLGGR